MNARLAIRLARPAVPHAKPKPCAVTVRAIDLAIAQWHVAGWAQEMREYEAQKAAERALERLLDTAKRCGC